MVEVERDLLRLSGPVPPLKQGPTELIAQDHAQMAFEWLQGGRLKKVSGQFMPVLSHSHNNKKVSWCSEGNSCVSVCTHCSGTFSGHHWREPGSVLFAALFQVFIDIGKIPHSLLFSRLFSKLSQPFFIGEMKSFPVPFQSLYHLCGSSLESLQYVHVSLVQRSPELNTVFQMWPHRWCEV